MESKRPVLCTGGTEALASSARPRAHGKPRSRAGQPLLPHSSTLQPHHLPGHVWTRPNYEDQLSPSFVQRPWKTGSRPQEQTLHLLPWARSLTPTQCWALASVRPEGRAHTCGTPALAALPEGLRAEPPSYPRHSSWEALSFGGPCRRQSGGQTQSAFQSGSTAHPQRA